jgi:oxygen-independent coproporphyrinogen-3 oxidase
MPGLYIHIPFCQKKCHYCDFYSIETSKGIIPKFLNALQMEIELYSEQCPFDTAVATIYLGGGTPSILPDEAIGMILEKIRSSFRIDVTPEITIEVNPGTVSLHQLNHYQSIGINRISIGLQSMQDRELQLLGRIHSSVEGCKAVHMAREAGFENINVDFIYGLPGQTLTKYQDTLEKMITLSPDHISAYTLTWNNETRMGQQIRSGILPYPNEDVVTDMYLATSEFLIKQGYEHYEISNYAKLDFRCRHNEGYWTGENYLGLGPSAHSFLGDKRYWNVSDVHEYIQVLSENHAPLAGEETLDPNQQALEQLALALRTREGVPLIKLSRKQNVIDELIKNGFAIEKEDHLSLNSKGFLLADEIALQFS